MKRDMLIFKRPEVLSANQPAEARNIARDEVRLLVSTSDGHQHAVFKNLPDFLRAGDLLIINRSGMLSASLPAMGSIGQFILNLSTHYGNNLWLTEPRWSPSEPGPLPLASGDSFCVNGITGQLVTPFPNLPRLWFIQFNRALDTTISHSGQPIRYGYVDNPYPLSIYQTAFATQPGSAEMPSASYPFTSNVIDALTAKGVQFADLTLHTGVSSLEVEVEDIDNHVLYPEPFEVPQATATAINLAKADGRRVIAIGTTVIRAIESAWRDGQVHSIKGFTRLYVKPGRDLQVVNGLVTGFHDSATSHLAMLYALAGIHMIQDAYDVAVREGYLWHEFGDSHLILPKQH